MGRTVKAAMCLWILLLFLALTAIPQSASTSDKPTPSEHRPGPHGLEGWTLDGPIPDHPGEKFPRTLVIARNGRVIRRFPGEGFIWRWKFLADGRQVAYESGPMHFVLACVLADIETGKELSRYDCFPELPSDAPDWVKTLEANP
jgi:hypothetical protein